MSELTENASHPFWHRFDLEDDFVVAIMLGLNVDASFAMIVQVENMTLMGVLVEILAFFSVDDDLMAISQLL